jgi:hypothetical protein
MKLTTRQTGDVVLNTSEAWDNMQGQFRAMMQEYVTEAIKDALRLRIPEA